MYHSVGSNAIGSIGRSLFESHIAACRDYLSALPKLPGEQQVFDRISCQTQQILLTFDDGYEDNFLIAAPILEQYGFRALFFVSTGFINGETDVAGSSRSYNGLRPMTWEQVGLLRDRGHEIGFHGHTHRSFGLMSTEQVAHECELGLSLLDKILSLRPASFAYPYGQFEHRSAFAEEFLAGAGIGRIFTTENRRAGENELAVIDSRTAIVPRLRIDPCDDVDRVTRTIVGEFDYVGYAQRFRSRLRGRPVADSLTIGRNA